MVIIVEMDKLEGALEAMLFSAGEPVRGQKLCEILDIDEKSLKRVIDFMSSKYDERDSGIRILALGDCYQMASRQDYADYVQDLMLSRRRLSLSPAALEVLSIVAYNQPVTRGYIEQIRGVDSGVVISNLCEKNLVMEAGKLDAPGRPNLYRTTYEFLRCFGLEDLSFLPALPRINDGEENLFGEQMEQEELKT